MLRNYCNAFIDLSFLLSIQLVLRKYYAEHSVVTQCDTVLLAYETKHSTDHELIPARNASLAAMQGSASWSNVRENIRPSKKEVNKAVTVHISRESPCGGVGSGAVRGKSVLVGGLKGCYWWKTVWRTRELHYYTDWKHLAVESSV
jgi:hypothetical protein